MATEYKIIYTYTGQDNTSGSRSVPLSKFKKSGDTGRTIGQIKSIIYEHWHTSTKAANWALRGRLVLSDGTSLVSDTVTQLISGTKVKFTNTFTSLPTPEQFAMVTAVQTLDSQGKTTADGYSAKLYWRANSDNPMRLIVTFVEEPPVVYAPKIDAFGVMRTDASGSPSEEGQYIRTSLKLSIGNNTVPSGATCKIYYAADAQPVVGVSQSVDLTSKISSLMTGVTNDSNIMTGVWNVGNTWFFTVVFTAGEETAISEVMHVDRGTTSMHISGEPGGGVCVGGFSTGTTANPKFESRVPAHFYAGVDGVTNYVTGEAKTGGKWVDGKEIYRAVYYINVTKTGSRVDYVVTLPAVDTLIGIRASIARSSGASRYPAQFWYSDTNYHNIWMEHPDSLSVKTSHAINGYVIVEYTKSADEAST